MSRLGGLYGFVLLIIAAVALLVTMSPQVGWLPLLGGEPTPTETPTAFVTATPLATRTPSPTPSPTHTPSPLPSPTASLTTVPVVSRALFVDQNAQVVHVYENRVEIKTLPCSTGKPIAYHWTPAWSGRVGRYVGTFFAFGAYADDAWYLFEGSGDILIHSAPYTYVDGVKVYQDLDALGVRPASHGCIRLAPEDARWLTEWDPEGVPISISPLTEEAPR